MRRILKRFTGLFCVLALCLSMLPVSALAAEDAPSNQSTTLLSDDNVAKIEENEYPTLDEAVEAAEDGATIELLADATMEFNQESYHYVGPESGGKADRNL